MKKIINERILVNLIASIVSGGKKDFPDIDTSNILMRLSRYHKVSGMIYPATLGADYIPKELKMRLHSDYIKNIDALNVKIEKDEELFDIAKSKNIEMTVISCYSYIYRVYEIEDFIEVESAIIYISPYNYKRLRNILMDLDYEEDVNYKAGGSRLFSTINEHSIIFFTECPYKSLRYRELFEEVISSAVYEYSVKFIYKESFFLYRIMEAVKMFMDNKLTIRRILELYLYYVKEDCDIDYISDRLNMYNIDIIAAHIIHLGYMYFGTTYKSVFYVKREDSEFYDKMEQSIYGYDNSYNMDFSYMKQAKKLKLRMDRASISHEDIRDKADIFIYKLKKVKRRILPGKYYMISKYNILKKYYFLIPLYYIYDILLRLIKRNTK